MSNPDWEPLLGISLLLVDLTPERWHVIDAQRRTVRHALRVVDVDHAGPAAAGLRVDDLVI
ncbi:MAG TPA: hypothetical protein VGP82_17650 [Ktedonobacterales bacterium]|nr:hypothetical protein [Ktedonobacterales bacterium]